MSLSCVSREQMKAFLVGTLTSEEEAELTAHMECCSDCERLAAELSDDEETREIAVASRKRLAVRPRRSRDGRSPPPAACPRTV